MSIEKKDTVKSKNKIRQKNGDDSFQREKDLELAAKIGKSLLERNKELQKTNEFLDEQVQLANEHVTQLKHELQQKVDLLQLFTELESESGGSTPRYKKTSLPLL